MNRRGQIFLLLTILSITFIFAVSTILLEIQRSQYLEPSPDIDETFETWDNTVYSIEQILSIQMAINTQAGAVDGNYSLEIGTELAKVENYALNRGFIASIDLVNMSYYFAPVAGNNASASINGTVFIQLESSSGNSINQLVEFDIKYEAFIDTGTNILTVSKIVNGQQSFIASATISGPGIITNFQNGSWELEDGAGLFDIITLDGVMLQVNY